MSKSLKRNKKNNSKPKIFTIKTVNKVKAVLLAKIETLIEYGRTEITTKEELEEYPIGSIVSYTNKNGIFKSGGFIIKFEDDYFIYITLDYSCKFRVRYKNINKMWVGDIYQVKNDVVSIIPTTNAKTNFKAKIGDVIVYYAKDNFGLKRFKNTQRYRNMVKWYEYFGGEN